MTNIICGYRKMTGLTQNEMAKKLHISEGTYRKKEKGLSSFKDVEMKLFHEVVSEILPTVSIMDIFFEN